METITRKSLLLACLLISSTSAMAIECLDLSLQCSNVVLHWPSVEGETYIVQYRPNLETNATWQTLTNSLPADAGTNLTVFVHPNVVQNPNCGGGGGSYAATAGGGGFDSMVAASEIETTAPEPDLPMVMPADSTGDPVPLILYPPEFDLSGFIIFDPATGEWVKGSGYIVNPRSFESQKLSGPDIQDSGSGSGTELMDGESEEAQDLGFYRVVRAGVHLWGISNGMTFSGVVTIPVEVGNELGTLDNLSLNENGSPVGEASIQSPPFSSPLTLLLDTTQMSNGTHQISARASWHVSENDLEPYFQADSPTVQINVQNEISFPDWMPVFGQDYDSLLITAQSAHADADWYIDVYDSQSEYIGTFAGHTYDGVIGVVWDLLGPYGEYHNDSSFQFVVNTVFDDGLGSGPQPQGLDGASALAPPTHKNYDRWGAAGDWVVANQQAWENKTGKENLDMMTDGFAQGAQTYGLAYRPNDGSGNAYRIHYNDSAEADSWAAFRAALYHPTSRNVFYSGHGGANGIGRDLRNTNSSISVTEIQNRLHTVPAGQTNRHAFRFVFLDGCETASGGFPEAFGIVHKENLSEDYYIASAERPSAFVGSNKSPSIAYANSINTDHWKFINNFQFRWATGEGLRSALDNANNGPLNYNVDVNPADLTVFGYKNLHVNQANTH